MTKCKICYSVSEKIFSKLILQTYSADFFKCTNCGFVQTSDPVWLKEAYNSAITSLDIGLVGRNIKFSKVVSEIIDVCYPHAKIMLDYAGGYGMFVRLMRDLGFNFYRQDIYCENIFAKNFDLTDLKQKKFDLVTAFEVFEHFVDPLHELSEILKYSDELIFSTEILPENAKDMEDWWYLSTETGQHVSFYSTKALELIARKFEKKLYSKFNSLHVFSSKTLSKDREDYIFKDIRAKSVLFGLKTKPLDFKIERKSLIDADYQYIKQLMVR